MLKKIIIGIVVTLMIIGVFFANGLFGNPVSKILVTKNAEKYIDEKYAGENYGIEYVGYDFKTSDYYVEVKSPDGTDRHFTLYAGFDGEIIYDTYDSGVTMKWNTADRINNAYIDAAETLFDGEKLPYKTTIAFGEIEFADGDYGEGEIVPDYAIDLESLTVDGEYDIYEMGKKAGCLTVYVEDEDVSAGRLAVILLRLKFVADKEKLGFRAVNCVLEYPMDENYDRKEGRVEVMRFAYDDIYEKDMTERVIEADEKARAYYDAENELKYLGDY